ncbi:MULTISPECIES: hypothetical protein [unclassified Mesorhizobium]|uniref:hypothetical protein n=1 Tax=unclassified Mesorhizobium TaxID=325217 RepID=UPI000BAE8353|nr:MULTISPECIES: hypothetical protein [unclassified Mesorhizobium]TGT61154.1 hypothetical protein EN813_019625 [Mesorhizobium sp. M00.F.Ca.ET.170.01.1.1]AZO08922.1 hypothetical protein EJ074_07245 [Mesorhizobium sp. M3A.F.Ca.ET.080.04.2.1]PBB84214.1 hypothetical protein CK216_24305 [Mesorhizobium sp. WSM3876]RWB68149.1 MAG: hypothetical protein EOQ49_23465 [Mesorhizobium sp.]RWB84608.1 MAG: hypothetical protein EOQ52_23785 [Mesorhizobium sp.]
MNWPYLRRGDIAGIVFMAIVLAGILFVLLFFPQRGQQNFGFGPEWQCTRIEHGDPICVRLVEKDAPGNLPP